MKKKILQKLDEVPKANSITINSIKKIVDKAIEKNKTINEFEDYLSLLEHKIKDVVFESKKNQEDDNNFVKTFNISGTSEVIQVQIKDAYSKLDKSFRKILKKVFKKNYSNMFEEIEESSLINEKKSELKKILGTRWNEFFETKEFIKPSSNFQRTLFSIKNDLSNEQNDVISKILEISQSAPTFKYPK